MASIQSRKGFKQALTTVLTINNGTGSPNQIDTITSSTKQVYFKNQSSNLVYICVRTSSTTNMSEVRNGGLILKPDEEVILDTYRNFVYVAGESIGTPNQSLFICRINVL